MSNIKFGSQTYPWQMNLSKFAGKIPHMVDILLQAGFTGMEAEICMLGDYYKNWSKFKELLDEKNVSFAALAVHYDWLHPQETTEEKEAVDQAIQFLTHFPTAKLMLGHVAADPVREHNLYEKQKNQMSCIRAIAQRASEQGIVSVYHPNSGEQSVFRYESDYHIMFDTLYNSGIGYCPDVGHMLNGGINPIKVIKEHRPIIYHVHFKDMLSNHTWATMGTGIGKFKEIVDFLDDTDYQGWIMTEDESPEAEMDSDGVVLADGAYMHSIQS